MARTGRVLLLLLAGLLVLWLLFTVIFPAVEGYFNDPTLGTLVGGGSSV